MSYAIELTPRARKFLNQVPRKIAGQIVAKLELLIDEPRPRGCEKLKPERNRFRIHSGNYRIIYEVQDKVLVILVIKIGHRQDVYKNL